MAKKLKVPKKIAGVKVPKQLRGNRHGPGQRELAAAALIAVAGALLSNKKVRKSLAEAGTKAAEEGVRAARKASVAAKEITREAIDAAESAARRVAKSDLLARAPAPAPRRSRDAADLAAEKHSPKPSYQTPEARQKRVSWRLRAVGAKASPMAKPSLQQPAANAAAASAVAAGKAVVRSEAEGLATLAAALDGGLGEAFAAAAATLSAAPGRVIVTGMGKSGHIARKIAATFASTGRPAYFVHPGEASHGDLGMITEADCVLAISRSGAGGELTDILHHCRRLKVPLIGMTFVAASALAEASDLVLLLPECGEASEAAPAPTISTTMCLALGDALAIALLDAAGFTTAHFRAIHPGGRLGAMLKHVRDVMRTGADLPLVSPEASIPAALEKMGVRKLGAVGVVDAGALVGIITDGDVRRKLDAEAFAKSARALMSRDPKVISPDASLADAMALLNEHEINLVFAVENGRVVGVVHLQDLLAAGVR
jgi:arabinose-5-phosphate isomerase